MQNVSCNYQAVPGKVVNFRADSQYGRYNPQAGVPQDMVVIQNQRAAEQQKKQNSRDKWQKAGVLGTFFLGISILGAAILPSLIARRAIKGNLPTPKASHEFDLSNLKFQKLKDDKSIADLKTTNTLQDQVKKFFMDMAESSTYEPKYIKRAGLTYKNFPNAGLLLGPSGAGKTESVKMFAKDQDAEFLIIKLGDFANSYVDGTATNMTKMFEELKTLFDKNPDKKYVVLFDEADGIAKKLGDISGDKDYLNKNRQAFLTGMDIIMPSRNVNVFAATNVTLKEMDEAVISRFGQNIEFELPNKYQLQEGLKFHLRDCEGIPDKFYESPELSEFLQSMVDHKYSFRDLQKVSSQAQALYCKDMSTQKKDLDFGIKYLKEALERKGKTSAEAADAATEQSDQYSVALVNLFKKILGIGA